MDCVEELSQGQRPSPDPGDSTASEPDGNVAPFGGSQPEGSPATPPAEEVANAVAGRLDGIEALTDKWIGGVLGAFNHKLLYDTRDSRRRGPNGEL